MPPLMPTLCDTIENTVLVSSRHAATAPSSPSTSLVKKTPKMPFVPLGPKWTAPIWTPTRSTVDSNHDLLPRKIVGNMVEDVEELATPNMSQEESNICFLTSVDSLAPIIVTASKSWNGVRLSQDEEVGQSINVPVTPPRQITLKRRRCCYGQDKTDDDCDMGCPTAVRRKLPCFPFL
jgi:hypothetical protein